MNLETYRHEIKYLCSAAEVEEILIRATTIADIDTHANGGKYMVRSIYFDDYYNTAYYDNESGNESREKWRIRQYDNDDSHIYVELKKKAYGLTSKETIQISKQEFESLVYGNIDGKVTYSINDKQNQLLNRLNVAIATKMLHPVVIVQYSRIPLVYKEGNVRITLDCDISTSTGFEEFFENEMSLRPIQSGHQQLLEVKYDEFLPTEVYDAVQLKNMTQIAFSKYYLCRKFGIGV